MRSKQKKPLRHSIKWTPTPPPQEVSGPTISVAAAQGLLEVATKRELRAARRIMKLEERLAEAYRLAGEVVLGDGGERAGLQLLDLLGKDIPTARREDLLDARLAERAERRAKGKAIPWPEAKKRLKRRRA